MKHLIVQKIVSSTLFNEVDMKVLKTFTAMALLTISFELKAQSTIPQSLTPRSFSGAGYKEYFIKSLQLISPADSATLLKIQSRLDQKSIQNIDHDRKQDTISQPREISADPKNYMNYLDPKGQMMFKRPRQSLALISH